MDEEQLVSGLRRRDPEAVQELIRAYGDRLLRAAFLLCGSETEAEDLVQETILQSLDSVHRFRSHSSIYTWLHAILLNLTRHYHRDRKRLIYDDSQAFCEVPAPEEPQATMDIGTAVTSLMVALNRLSAAHREVIILRFYEDMKLDEIARQLDISKGTVKSRLHYAIGEMQKLLPQEMNLFGSGGTQ
jgi:RNA polymerase sigma-70 factor (ECF subfamily)